MTLSDHQSEIAQRVIAEEAQRRRHVVVALSGAHAYGFPSPDSDLDIKAVHLAPTSALLGLPKTFSGSERFETIEGVEIDYSSNELGGVIAGILGGNGNYIERILGALLLERSPEHAELAELTKGAFSKRVYAHYRGFAANQRKSFDRKGRTAKRLLYVLRTALTGVHLLETGELRVDLSENAPEYGYADATELIAAKRAGEQTVLDDSMIKLWRGRLDGVFARLASAHSSSELPDAPTNAAAFEAWLVKLRLSAI